VTIRDTLQQLSRHPELNFVLTNRIPRQLVTRLMGRFSQIEHPWVRDISLAAWQLFTDLELEDAASTEFRSLHDCFIRQLKPGSRPIDPDPRIFVSPCDGIVGAFGRVDGTQVIQAKGHPYSLGELLVDPNLVERYRDGVYVTLRLTSAMYHRFHAPHDGQIERVTYVRGDTWNTNWNALTRVDKLYCKNERAVLRMRLGAAGHPIVVVPVAAIMVASIRLHFLDVLLHLKYPGPNVIPCAAPISKGQELGYFQHGSTVLVFAPKGFSLCDSVRERAVVRMGERLLRSPDAGET
jgi:phosphatidylserine decarboxylase